MVVTLCKTSLAGGAAEKPLDSTRYWLGFCRRHGYLSRVAGRSTRVTGSRSDLIVRILRIGPPPSKLMSREWPIFRRMQPKWRPSCPNERPSKWFCCCGPFLMSCLLNNCSDFTLLRYRPSSHFCTILEGQNEGIERAKHFVLGRIRK